MIEFIEKYHLDRTMDLDKEEKDLRKVTDFDARGAFGSHDDADHTYNTQRAWFILRYLNPNTFTWEGPDADFTPMSDNMPWSLVPERKISIEEVKYALSGHYQNTEYDPYGGFGPEEWREKFRPIGINRNTVLSVTQIRPYMPEEIRCLQWVAFGSNAFNSLVPFYTNVEDTPEYMKNTTAKVSTDSFYWSNRLIAALADPHFQQCANLIEQYQNKVAYESHRHIHESDDAFTGEKPQNVCRFLEERNQKISDFTQECTDDLMDKVLFTVSMQMRNKFSRSDA
jgi:dipeptidase